MAIVATDLDSGPFNLSRRGVLKGALAVATARCVFPRGSRAAPRPVWNGAPDALSVAGWRTWLLSSGDELRPAGPASPTADEVAELLSLQARRTGAMADVVARWGAGPAVLPWTALALDLIRATKPSPPRAARALAHLHVATYDAVVAAWDAQDAYRRPAPLGVVAGLTPLGDIAADRPSYPSEQAAVAGAAATVLAYFFPKEPVGHFDTLATEASTSRLLAGVAYRSDIEAGLWLGRAIGERAVARGRGDGADATWSGERPSVLGYWEPTPPDYVETPIEPTAGTWRPWVIGDVVSARPAPPAPYGSPAWRSELAAVQEAVARRTDEQAAAAVHWAGIPGTVSPGGLWVEIARDLILRDRLDTPHAARVLALTTAATVDAFICCWDAKYAYWTARPITADPTINVSFETPPFPSYTSGHATVSAAAATVLGHLFPEDEWVLQERALEAKNSRLWAGIHFPIDNDMGAAMGAILGRLVADVARGDGAV